MASKRESFCSKMTDFLNGGKIESFRWRGEISSYYITTSTRYFIAQRPFLGYNNVAMLDRARVKKCFNCLFLLQTQAKQSLQEPPFDGKFSNGISGKSINVLMGYKIFRPYAKRETAG